VLRRSQALPRGLNQTTTREYTAALPEASISTVRHRMHKEENYQVPECTRIVRAPQSSTVFHIAYGHIGNLDLPYDYEVLVPGTPE
jgi:hypothetical protein